MKTARPSTPATAAVKTTAAKTTAVKTTAVKKNLRGGSTAYTFMRSPDSELGFDVGDTVEAYCDHEKNTERIRGWLKGIVVQVDNKMVAVQFRSNVFLTDGWMVPDRILWYPTHSLQIRSAQKKSTKKELPDF